jgi:hypothetical protein
VPTATMLLAEHIASTQSNVLAAFKKQAASRT